MLTVVVTSRKYGDDVYFSSLHMISCSCHRLSDAGKYSCDSIFIPGENARNDLDPR